MANREDLHRGKLELKNQKPKYQITAPTGKLAETDDVRLNVHYNVQPWVGVLTWEPQVEFGRWKRMKGGLSKVFSLPALKKKEETKKVETKKEETKKEETKKEETKKPETKKEETKKGETKKEETKETKKA
jgi:hypothetical protein